MGDKVFLAASFLILATGCALVLDHAAAQSAARESVTSHTLGQISHWWQTFSTSTAITTAWKYFLLIQASILNSALIVALVHGLRSIDSRVARPQNVNRLSLRLNRESGNGGLGNVRRPKGYSRIIAAPLPASSRAPSASSMETHRFLLSPVFK